MGNLTNKHGLSKLMETAMQPEPYVPCGQSDYSATSLINPPQQVQLVKRHKDKIERDVKDSWLLWLGNAVHNAVENGLKSDPDYLVERKITRQDQGRRVVAKFDAYDVKNKTLYDHKTTTVFIHGGEAKDEWAQQLNINAYFLEEEGHPVDKAVINAIYMDWRPGMAKFKSADDYPQLPNHEVPVYLMPQEKRKEFYDKLLAKHIAAEELPDENLPECTPEEMWEKPASFAVKTKGVYRARRVLSTREEAEQWLEQNKDKYANLYIEERPGVRTRCEQYCDAAPFCHQYQKWLKEKEALNNGERKQ